MEQLVYQDSGKLENERQQREVQRKIELTKIRNLRLRQNNCPHILGQNGIPFNGNEPAFEFLKLPTGETIGVCLYCFKIISSIDPSDETLFKWAYASPKGERRAEADQILEEDDNQLFGQLARFAFDERIRILKETISKLKGQVLGFQRKEEGIESDNVLCNEKAEPSQFDIDTDRLHDLPMEELKILAQKQIDDFRK